MHRRPIWPASLSALVAFVALTALAHAEPAEEGIDTEHLFGFTEGSDITPLGERELESESTARIGKRGGRFHAIDSALTMKLPVTERVRVSPGISFAHYHMKGVPGVDDRTVLDLGGGFIETRARLIDRSQAPFGVTLNTVSGLNRIDSATGIGARGFSTEAGLLMDRELVPGELVAAVNVVYGFSRARLDGHAALQHLSGFEVSGALAQKFGPGFFLGIEARHLRSYSGLGLDDLLGQATFVGPTLYKELGHGTWVSLAWGAQVAGREVGARHPLDLTSFDRRQARLRLGCHF